MARRAFVGCARNGLAQGKKRATRHCGIGGRGFSRPSARSARSRGRWCAPRNRRWRQWWHPQPRKLRPTASPSGGACHGGHVLHRSLEPSGDRDWDCIIFAWRIPALQTPSFAIARHPVMDASLGPGVDVRFDLFPCCVSSSRGCRIKVRRRRSAICGGIGSYRMFVARNTSALPYQEGPLFGCSSSY